MNNYLQVRVLIIVLIFSVLALVSTFCKPEAESLPPTIELIFDASTASDGDTFAVGRPIRFRIKTYGEEANITNFLVEKVHNGNSKTVLDSGLNSSGFDVVETFYQGVEDTVDWTFSVMDRNRKSASLSIRLFRDPNSAFGGIVEFNEVILGFQENQNVGHFFLPELDKVYFEDSASLYQELVDVLCYFNYKEDNGVSLPSPTFSSPGEDLNANGDLYDEYYPFLSNWQTRNYTKYDIRAVNGITNELYQNAHNDSLLIVSYDDVWGKKKYKWAMDGTYIPFQTAAGRKGIIYVIETDTLVSGQIKFSMKLQMPLSE
jgi:hypothetical protein